MKKLIQYMQKPVMLLLACSFLATCIPLKKEDVAVADPTVAAYLSLKDALVETDASKAAIAAKQLSENATGMIQEKAGEIAASSDVEAQRIAFEDISKALYDKMQAENTSGATLYKQYCPMAFNDKGAFWLSSEKEIMNPYFGDKMLHCGKVDETLAKK